MGTAREPQPVKLIASLLTEDLTLLAEAKAALSLMVFLPLEITIRIAEKGQL